MEAISGRRSATERELAIQALAHFTLPVRDFNVGHRFYVDVLGGEVTKEPDVAPSGGGGSFGGHMAVQMFNGEGHLVLYRQPWGQPLPDQIHPRRALSVASPKKLDEIIRRLGAAGVPCVLATPRSAAAGEPVAATAYFRDPDGNQLAVVCARYPFGPAVHVGTFDPWTLIYPWTAWSDASAAGGTSGAAPQPEPKLSNDRGFAIVTRELDFEGVDHFTLPVRDLPKARRFYAEVVGAEILAADTTEAGATEQAASRVQVCPGVTISLVKQRYGWLPVDVSNPHWAFEIAPGEVDEWVRHLESWGVPSALVVREGYAVEEGKPTRVELHFLDPDGTQIEFLAYDYPMNSRVPVGQYNAWELAYRHDRWPDG